METNAPATEIAPRATAAEFLFSRDAGNAARIETVITIK
jgi:hypothetical protein